MYSYHEEGTLRSQTDQNQTSASQPTLSVPQPPSQAFCPCPSAVETLGSGSRPPPHPYPGLQMDQALRNTHSLAY